MNKPLKQIIGLIILLLGIWTWSLKDWRIQFVGCIIFMVGLALVISAVKTLREK
jgi:protein-S-isoprenylcysteine O-methyltransferase Ste14